MVPCRQQSTPSNLKLCYSREFLMNFSQIPQNVLHCVRKSISSCGIWCKKFEMSIVCSDQYKSDRSSIEIPINVMVGENQYANHAVFHTDTQISVDSACRPVSCAVPRKRYLRQLVCAESNSRPNRSITLFNLFDIIRQVRCGP